MAEFLNSLLEAGAFMPHGHCYLWNPGLVRLHLFSDLAIGVAYVVISLTLAYFVRRAKTDLPFSWIFVAFGVFILACGATHFMEIWTLWFPLYWLAGLVKVVTAAASIATAIVLPPLIPKSLTLIRSARLSEQRKADLEEANQALEADSGKRKKIEEEIRKLNLELEERVRTRTAELADANQRLAHLAAIVEHADEAIVGVNLDHSITSWNPAAERMYGYLTEEVLGRSIALLAPPERPGETTRLIERIRRGERVDPVETIRIRKSGERIAVHLTLSPIRGVGGEVQGASYIARDITERRRAEDMFRLVVEAAPNAMVVADAQGKIVLVNNQTEKVFGYSREELIGREVDILVPLKYRGKHPAYRTEFMCEPRARAMGAGRDLRGLRKDGSEFPVEIGLNPIETEQGIWVLSAIVDITERKRAEDKFRLVVEAAPSAMVVADSQGKIVLVNNQTEKLFGYPREELIGREVDILVPLRYRDKHPANRSEFMRDPRARAMGAGRDLCGLRKDGSEFPVEIGLNPIQTEHGTWVLSAIVDITERKRAEIEINLLNQELEGRVIERTAELTAANAELESFSYSVSHDLRAPLRQITGFSNILVEAHGQELSSEAQRYLQRVQDGASHMGSLIDDLLNLARIGRHSVSRRPTALNGLIEAALEVLKTECAGREIEWQIDRLWTVECDPGLLKQVFVNILSNAVKYTRIRDRAVIQVGHTMANGERVVFVRDNGAGFDMQYASKLFGVFQRMHRVQDFEGTGVGLATCQRIIHKHGGRIWAEAEPDKGAIFFFTIPNGPGSKQANGVDSGKRNGAP